MREYQEIPLKIFCLTRPKLSVGESFSVSLIAGFGKTWIKGGEYQDFPSNFFCLAVPKKIVEERFSVSLISSIEKFYTSKGYVRICVVFFV